VKTEPNGRRRIRSSVRARSLVTTGRDTTRIRYTHADDGWRACASRRHAAPWAAASSRPGHHASCTGSNRSLAFGSVTLDFRTRYDRDIEPVDVTNFFEVRLPHLAAERSDLCVRGALELGLQPFSIETPVGTWTLAISGDRVTVNRGEAAPATVRLDQDEVSDIVHDLRTPMTLLTAGTLDMRRGNVGAFLDWWVVLRSLLDARPAHTAGSIEFKDHDGAPLDLGRAFRSDDDPAEMAHFLEQAGYLHLTRVFTEKEMAQVSSDMDAAFPHYQPDDGRSWWATTATGAQRPVRLQWFHEQSPTTTALLADDRLLRIAQLTGDGHRLRDTGNRVEALVKPIGVVQGISDVPWHKDCSLGRHSYRCCSLTVGISVTGADEQSGQLGVVPGSHRALVQPAFFRREWGLPARALPTGTGDVTVHCSCTLHMSHPPVKRERRVMYTDFILPLRASEDAVSASSGEISRVREQAYKTVSQAPGHTSET
jgi:Phytanoyl-CoA dioxygenase (PhyH)